MRKTTRPRRAPDAVRLISCPVPSTLAAHGGLSVALDSDPPRPAPRPVRSAHAPPEHDVRAAAHRITRLLVEVLAGLRPHHHLAGHTSPEVYELLAPVRPHAGRGAAHVRMLRISGQTPDTAEVTAVVAVGDRVHALALRLERARDRWRCAIVETTIAVLG